MKINIMVTRSLSIFYSQMDCCSVIHLDRGYFRPLIERQGYDRLTGIFNNFRHVIGANNLEYGKYLNRLNRVELY